MSRQIKILHLNSGNFGSTGNIMLNIGKKAEECGYISYVAYANSRTNKNKVIDRSILVGNVLERNLHLQLSYYTGRNGCFSIRGTRKFLEKVKEINPDIIHLHNLHNCYINLEMLFNFIKEKNISVIWTLHDCWAFTGQCPHFSMVQCEKWKTGCFDCPQYKEYPASRVDKTKEMYNLKKEWFTGVKNLKIVTPSQWLADRVNESFLKDYQVKVINNGINLDVFKPTPSNFREKYDLTDKKVLLGVANPWSERKGLNIFIELAKRLDERYIIVLVGLSEEQLKKLPINIIGFSKTNNPQELAQIYTAADYFINPSMEETMGLVTVEALACGTPVIVANSTAVPEMVGLDCGAIVSKNNTDGFLETINGTSDMEFSRENCIAWAKQFEVNVKLNEYINVYNSIDLR